MKAKIKTVRPFKKTSALTEQDQAFSPWIKKNWDKLNIEVGCGAGLHPILFAKSHPQEALVAIERTHNKFSSFMNRLNNHAIHNVHPVHQDALYWLPHHIQPDSVDSYFFLYPNPYPKESQANKRWHRTPLMEFILESLKEDGKIHMASNEQWYIEEAIHYMTHFWKLHLDEEQFVSDMELPRPRTHFEKKYLLRGSPCKNIIFSKQPING